MSVQGQVIRVVLLDDYQNVAAGLAGLLQPYGDRFHVQPVSIPEPVPADADVVLYDPATAPTGERLKLHAALATSAARLVLYSWETPLGEHAAAGSAAFGFLSKAATGAQVAEALERVVDGGRWRRGKVQPSTHADPLSGHAASASVEGLSFRESQVLSLIALGFSNAAVAHHANLSINSVKTYVRSAYAKIGVSSRTQAVRWSIEHGLVPEPLPHHSAHSRARPSVSAS